MAKFNPSRLKLARARRGLTMIALARKAGISHRMVVEYEKSYCLYEPSEQTISAFAEALKYPAEFFFGNDIETIEPSTVSFRSLKKMTAAQEGAAIGAGQLGVLVSNYFEENFKLPELNLPDLRGEIPENAARALREYWRLGSKSISNMVHLLEMNGIKVFSLSENATEVDAYSFWKAEKAYVFLNNQKTAERSRFDAAHELGHLVLHKHGSPQGKDVEAEANQFASAFLMPKENVLAVKMRSPSVDDISQLRHNWIVSTFALIYRMRQVGAITTWQYNNLVREASARGFRTKEDKIMERERSLIIDSLLESLSKDGITLPVIARKLNVPLGEISNLLFRFGLVSTV
ncbi:ImmA/IrrE family metallo-endopeptidase [Klebsiella quasipneumoniae]|uniref:helix-turn-helix domain-containing protein n=1 Tax=Klebsiella quasipneumoniae TaxID=1463165 RepID=UPI0015D84C06|nr:ImmA/IrrE family metallo-endopeptidase [Klebsiella quasipneumoniae]HCI5669082.1 ImmA/IrrE family metallo-endopeptidase [Klebsiella pneumoniae]MBQ5273204.1 ImmA/IrrE family metallo-endopeptidase [Klebsiella quasipneumoniae]UAA05209.1 ImmA/IrrE family metallo-endopeptidase [Klebsiella quasipneumoniae]UPS72185.1 ImmA/IrrE family metallo-endopeptidase [Klebsiella quasipneumoniae]BBQ65828.1 transcriptional regulator [Klebsiella quasipneumoniae]